MTSILLNIGGFTLSVISKDLGYDEIIPENYRAFLSSGPPDILLEHSVGVIPDLDGWELCFDTGGTWKMYSQPGYRAISLTSTEIGPNPFHLAIFRDDFLYAKITTNQIYFKKRLVQIPFVYPLLELLYANLLSLGRGLIVHAFAIKDGENGLLFAGNSGAGKSTLARLWGSRDGACLLSDDRLILRKETDGFRIYGTPWHGDARTASVESAVLKQIYILKHAPENSMTSLRPVDLAAKLYARSFPPYWSQDGLSFTLDLLKEVCQEVPGSVLNFLPVEQTIDFIRAETPCLKFSSVGQAK
jgi:hypothetical protein